MKTLTVAAAKGGATKTTVTLSLAVAAVQDKQKVALFDLNGDQGDLTKWHTLRGKPKNPALIQIENIVRDIEAMRSDPDCPFNWLLVDVPPSDLDVIESAIIKSDAVLIPLRPAFFDIDAVTPIVEMCRDRRKPFSFLLSAVDTKMPKLVDKAMAALVNDGPVFATRLRYLQPYILSINLGKSAAEISKDCDPEIKSLWAEVKRLADTPVAAAKGRAAS